MCSRSLARSLSLSLSLSRSSTNEIPLFYSDGTHSWRVVRLYTTKRDLPLGCRVHVWHSNQRRLLLCGAAHLARCGIGEFRAHLLLLGRRHAGDRCAAWHHHWRRQRAVVARRHVGSRAPARHRHERHHGRTALPRQQQARRHAGLPRGLVGHGPRSHPPHDAYHLGASRQEHLELVHRVALRGPPHHQGGDEDALVRCRLPAHQRRGATPYRALYVVARSHEQHRIRPIVLPPVPSCAHHAVVDRHCSNLQRVDRLFSRRIANT